MSTQLVSAELTDEQVDQAILAVEALKTQFPFIVTLKPDEAKKIYKMGDKSLPFVDKALKYASLHPDYVPPFVNVAELTKDLELYRKLKKVLDVLLPLTNGLSSTSLVAGSEAFAAARSFYSSAKTAANAKVYGFNHIVNELAKRYSYSAGKSKKVEEKETVQEDSSGTSTESSA
ncbi:MAG: hypothetical protein GY757_54425 [bacterium]|nr:hypothetical protein [bacterium]